MGPFRGVIAFKGTATTYHNMDLRTFSLKVKAVSFLPNVVKSSHISLTLFPLHSATLVVLVSNSLQFRICRHLRTIYYDDVMMIKVILVPNENSKRTFDDQNPPQKPFGICCRHKGWVWGQQFQTLYKGKVCLWLQQTLNKCEEIRKFMGHFGNTIVYYHNVMMIEV